MSSTTLSMRNRNHTWLLVAILALAAGLRLWGLTHDLPFSYFGDELHLMKRSMALGSGDLNPHWFNKPGFLMYLLLGCYGLYFVAGWTFGRFESIDEFAAHFLTDTGPFLLIGRTVVCLAGVALVFMVYLIGKRGLKSSGAGLIGALIAAVLPSLVVASQTIKADAPCALLVAISVFIYLRAKDESSIKRLALSALAAGAAMGTKYCGVVLLPAYFIWEIVATLRSERKWRTTVARCSTLLLVFVVGFFATSPYNFLDPTWAKSMWNRGQSAIGAIEQPVAFDPDSKIIYETGVSAWPGATAHFLGEMSQPYLGGLMIQLIGLLGLILGLRSTASRSYSLLIMLIVSSFLILAVLFFPFHVSARHLTILVPLTAPLVGFAVVRAATAVPTAPRARALLTVVLGIAICLPSFAITIRHNLQVMRFDSRTLAHEWIVDNLASARILVEDEGPTLNPSRPAVERMRKDLARLDPGPFTNPQKKRLELLDRYPPSDGLDIDRLGHPWWLAKEIPEEQLRKSHYHTRVGNPLVQRIPEPLAEYRRDGIEFVITNGKAQRLMQNRPNFQEAFPSFARFYAELESAHLVQTFDPEDWDGKGPEVWIYDIRSLE